jgi:hypothetical protein
MNYATVLDVLVTTAINRGAPIGVVHHRPDGVMVEINGKQVTLSDLECHSLDDVNALSKLVNKKLRGAQG